MYAILCVATNQIKRLHRDEKVQKQYNQWMTDVLHAYGTIENYLLLNKLHFTLTTSKDRPPVILLPNDFPYNVASDIKHILIWSLQPLNRDYIEDILNINYGSHLYEWVYFVNPPEIQSVRKLPHVHVFIRPLK
ncbi:hypothetical protein BDB01DRAFT_487125 [Pilobolus umbonatus]|nr:hypothetical protein BDB01DRAFT_487125 [Pilobolus umbonatus]